MLHTGGELTYDATVFNKAMDVYKEVMRTYVRYCNEEATTEHSSQKIFIFFTDDDYIENLLGCNWVPPKDRKPKENEEETPEKEVDDSNEFQFSNFEGSIFEAEEWRNREEKGEKIERGHEAGSYVSEMLRRYSDIFRTYNHSFDDIGDLDRVRRIWRDVEDCLLW